MPTTIEIHEPIPWQVFERNLQLEPISFENLINILFKKENIFIEDPHIKNYMFNQLIPLLNSLPEFGLYLEYSKKRIDKFDFLKGKLEALMPFRERIFSSFIEVPEDLPYQIRFQEKEKKIKFLLNNSISKKIIYIGKDHIRPGNGIHTYSSDLSQIVLIYCNLTNEKINSKYNHIKDSENKYGFNIFEIRK